MHDTTAPYWWHELNCHDLDAAAAFYHRTLGWEFEDARASGGGAYLIARRDGRPVAGFHRLAAESRGRIPAHWLSYMMVEDMDDAIETARASGGRIVRPPFEVPGVGRLALITDNHDALIGLFEAAADHPLAVAATAASGLGPHQTA
ncbi:MAG TPA: VOC family protein [Thermopetrobacter sp.]|nr:VOC family protein [Thermopetrobacter sp.]